MFSSPKEKEKGICIQFDLPEVLKIMDCLLVLDHNFGILSPVDTSKLIIIALRVDLEENS